MDDCVTFVSCSFSLSYFSSYLLLHYQYCFLTCIGLDNANCCDEGCFQILVKVDQRNAEFNSGRVDTMSPFNDDQRVCQLSFRLEGAPHRRPNVLGKVAMRMSLGMQEVCTSRDAVGLARTSFDTLIDRRDCMRPFHQNSLLDLCVLKFRGIHWQGVTNSIDYSSAPIRP
jgi:hypothetical protein